MKRQKAIVLTNGLLETEFAKTCHGLLRGSDRFEVLAVIDAKHAGKDAGAVMEGRPLRIPVFGSIEAYFSAEAEEPDCCVVGVAFPGGKLPDELRTEILTGIGRKLDVVCGLHTLLGDDPELKQKAEEEGITLTDVRRPKPASQLRFWNGEIYKVKTPRIAVLGMDCAAGKRTTCRFLMETCRSNGIAAEMIYTGQTGWMQGYPHGFILDSTLNDFVCGEIERVIVECERNANPDLILIEGQSALRNPSGPCGSEILLAGNVKGVVLMHLPGRRCFDDTPTPMPSLESEIDLIQNYYQSRVLAIALNEEGMTDEAMRKVQTKLQAELGIPIIRPLVEGVQTAIPAIKAYMEDTAFNQGDSFSHR